MDRTIEAKDRSVAAAEIISSIIVTGKNSRVFVDGYRKLSDSIIQPEAVFKKVQIDCFVGRKWLMDKIDTILNEKSCGYIVLEADAGLGKTAFMAWLVKERKYVHHFVELAPGQEGIERGLKNLAAQLIIAYKLNADEAFPDATARPDYLYRLLSKAAENRQPNEKIIVVVDALDEAGTPYNQNVLGLPKVLPEGVFLIVSLRPVQVALQVDRSATSRTLINICALSNENQDDMRAFLKVAASWPGVSKSLEESRYEKQEFIDVLMKKCQGVWIYLHFVIHEIEQGERSPLNLEKLPDGLSEYYAGYWSQWREEKEWYNIYLPILTALAVVQEPCTFDRLVDFAGIKRSKEKKSRLKRILKENWRPFLAVHTDGMTEKFRFNHATVREFFEGKVEQENLLEHERVLVNELVETTSERHRKIAERYLFAWGCLKNNLPDLNNKKDLDESYGQRHLAVHLVASKQAEKLHCLLGLETPQQSNIWYQAKGASGDLGGYINDVMRAWHLAEEGYNPEAIKGTGRFIGMQNRYALIFASINSLSDSIPPELLIALVENGSWSKEQGLAHARQVTNPEMRSRKLVQLSLLLKEPEILVDALTVAREIQDEWERDRALAEIAPRLNDAQEALAVAQEIRNESKRDRALAEIVPRMNDAQEALALAREIRNEREYARALAEIAPRQALTVAREIQNESERDRALAEIAPRLKDPQEALAVAREIRNEWYHGTTLAKIAPRLLDAQEALAVARETRIELERVRALAEIAPRLKDAQKTEVLDKALAEAQVIQDEGERDRALAEIAPRLQDTQKALAVTRKIRHELERIRALAEIASRLQDAQKKEVLDEALIVGRVIRDKGMRAKSLAKIAPGLQDAQKTEVLDEALAVTQVIQDEGERDKVLAKIAPRLQDAQEALVVAREIQNEGERIKALAEIAPRLQNAQVVLSVAREIQDEGERDRALAEIAPRLQNAQVALVVAQVIQDEWERDRALAEIASGLQDAQEALAVARGIWNKWERAKALSEIAPKLKDAQEALAVAQVIQDESEHDRALAEIAPRLQDAQEALAIAREIRNQWYRDKALAAIVLRLQDTQVALSVARRIWDELERAKALAEIAPRLQDIQKIEVLNEALSACRVIKDEMKRAKALAEIAPRLQDTQKIEVLNEALSACRVIKDEMKRAKALAEIAPRLQDTQKIEVLNEALSACRVIKDEMKRARALAEIGPRLQDTQKIEVLNEALSACRVIKDELERAKALAEIAPKLEGAQKIEVLNEALSTSRAIQNEEDRAKTRAEIISRLLEIETIDYISFWLPIIRRHANQARPDLLSDLSFLMPLVAKLGGDDAVRETASAVVDVGRWWP